MGRMIGIDLGTTNCCIAVLQDGDAQVINSRQGERTMPSVVAFSDEGTEIVGTTAQRQAVTNPNRTIFGVKRLIGRKFGDEEIETWSEHVPYEICAAPNGDAWVRTRDGDYSPQEISAVILQEIKAIAEDFLGEEIGEAVITVPAYFNDSQRQATKDAGTIAGLRVKNIVNEPTAAALGYGIDKNRDQTLAIFDLGGGTFDITILKTEGGVFEVLATHGDTFLGGDDFDRLLIEYLLDQFEGECGEDISDDPVALQRLKESAETAKRELSSTSTTSINLPFIATGPDGPLHLRVDVLERTKVERLCEQLIDRLEAPCKQALADAGIVASDLDQVLLVGGMTRMPAVQAKVEEIFGKITAKDVNPDEIVAVGAATQCAIMTGEVQDVVLLDVTPHSLGVRVTEGRMSRVIEKNTTIPTSEKKLFATTRDQQDHVEISVYQGEDELVDNNSYLGRFVLGDLPQAAAGKVNVEVTFLMDADGVLNVKAREVTTGREASVKIAPSSGLSKDEVRNLSNRRRKAS
ncbi:MAG: molecular chaperone DnaK [Myxococcales bacterium]|nr:molecular chaperone DnaK [Myxococcales bacterium]